MTQNLPLDFGRLVALKTLNISENNLKKFPEQLTKLPALEMLDLSSNKIAEMADTPAISNLNCSELILNVNQLSLLPTNLAKCPRLKVALFGQLFSVEQKLIWDFLQIIRCTSFESVLIRLSSSRYSGHRKTAYPLMVSPRAYYRTQ